MVIFHRYVSLPEGITRSDDYDSWLLQKVQNYGNYGGNHWFGHPHKRHENVEAWWNMWNVSVKSNKSESVGTQQLLLVLSLNPFQNIQHKSHWKSQNVPNTPQTVTAKPSLINHNIPQLSQRKDNNILPPRTSCGTAATIKKLCRIGFLEFHSMLIKSLWQNATRPGKLSQFDMVNG